MEDSEETRFARDVAHFAQLKEELDVWESRHVGEIWHIEAQVGLGQQAFSVRIWFLIGDLLVPTVYEAVHSPDGTFTVYAQKMTDGFYVWERTLVNHAAELTQALNAAYDSARIRRLYLGLPLKTAQCKPTDLR